MKKRIFITIIEILMIVFFSTTTYAIMGTGMAGFDDKTADEIQKKEQEEWKKEQEERITKSSNNYLKSLSIDNYEITPKFEKQTINYEVIDEVKGDTIKINAELDNEKAKITGNGEVKLEDGENNIEITVTAENGTVRTYYIKAKKSAEITTTNNIEKNVENEINSNTNITAQKVEKKESPKIEENSIDTENHKKIIIISIVIVIVIVIIIIAVISIIIIKSKNKYHSKH